MINALPVFVVSCPSCRTEFPVDPEKVPSQGVHAICSTCMRVFQVERPHSDEAQEAEPWREDATSAPVDVAPPVGEVEAPVEDEVEALAEDEVKDSAEGAEATIEEAGTVVADVAVAPEEEEAALEDAAREDVPGTTADVEDLSRLTSESADEEDAGTNVAESSLSLGAAKFGKRDPHDRARRLARVLVSDIIAYYPARYRNSFDGGTLKQDFDDEVRKSWKEYVDQVGVELAESTSYFEEALNEILGQGQKIF